MAPLTALQFQVTEEPPKEGQTTSQEVIDGVEQTAPGVGVLVGVLGALVGVLVGVLVGDLVGVKVTIEVQLITGPLTDTLQPFALQACTHQL